MNALMGGLGDEENKGVPSVRGDHDRARAHISAYEGAALGKNLYCAENWARQAELLVSATPNPFQRGICIVEHLSSSSVEALANLFAFIFRELVVPHQLHGVVTLLLYDLGRRSVSLTPILH